MTTKLVSTGVEFPDATTQTTSGVPLTGGTMTGALTTTNFTSTGIDDNATSTAITIDASENVGIGVVPEGTLSTTRTQVQLGGNSMLGSKTAQGANSDFFVGNNVKLTATGDQYISTDEASNYSQTDGKHIFYVAPSGTADSAISWTTAMNIDNSGAVTMPLQPAFSVYNNTAQNDIASGLWTAINMDTEIFDQNADFNTGTYTFTAPVTGKYLLTTQVSTKDMDNATAWYITAIATSNRGYNGSRTTAHWSADSNGFNHGVPITAVADMDANDTAYVRLYRYSGAATGDIVASPEYSFFQGYLLG